MLSIPLVNKINRAIFKIRNPKLSGQIRLVKERKLTYLDMEALIDLVNAVRRVEKLKVPGIIIEIGGSCY